MFATANYIEAGFWIVIGLGFCVQAIRLTGRVQNQCIVASIALVLFGLSDVIEVQTGAWWRPWWLFAWKAACVIVLFVLIVIHWRGRRSA